MLNDAAFLAIARKTEFFYSSKTTKTFVLIAFLLIYKGAYKQAAANQIKSWYQYLTYGRHSNADCRNLLNPARTRKTLHSYERG